MARATNSHKKITKHRNGYTVLSKPSENGTQRRLHYFPIVVIGASAGGFSAILSLVKNIPPQADAALFIVLHLSEQNNVSFLVQHVQKHTSLRCRIAAMNERVKSNTIYFGLPGMHLLFEKGKIIYGKGTDESGFKPSIDVLFRSAAVEFRERVTGIILSGLMDDGVAGMSAIRQCGGTCMVQDPTEAEYPELPLAVTEKMHPDYTLLTGAMGMAIAEEGRKQKKKGSVPVELKQETEIAQRMLSDIDDTRKLGTQSLFTCPDCGGSLFLIKDGKLKRYRCFTGHAYTEHMLLEKQDGSVQKTLWVALRMMEEQKKLQEKYPGMVKPGSKDIEIHIKQLKALLADLVHLKGNALFNTAASG